MENFQGTTFDFDWPTHVGSEPRRFHAYCEGVVYHMAITREALEAMAAYAGSKATGTERLLRIMHRRVKKAACEALNSHDGPSTRTILINERTWWG